MLTLSEAAEQLEISRAALDNWIKRLGIEKKKDGRIGLTAKEVDQIRKQRSENSRRPESKPAPKSKGTLENSVSDSDLQELQQAREQLQQWEQERQQWREERRAFVEREESARLERSNWQSRFEDSQRRTDWLQGQLESSSREKSELIKQADQFQQLLLQKERSLQRILEEKQELQQQLQTIEQQALPAPATPPSLNESTPPLQEEEPLPDPELKESAASAENTSETEESFEDPEDLLAGSTAELEEEPPREAGATETMNEVSAEEEEPAEPETGAVDEPSEQIVAEEEEFVEPDELMAEDIEEAAEEVLEEPAWDEEPELSEVEASSSETAEEEPLGYDPDSLSPPPLTSIEDMEEQAALEEESFAIQEEESETNWGDTEESADSVELEDDEPEMMMFDELEEDSEELVELEMTIEEESLSEAEEAAETDEVSSTKEYQSDVDEEQQQRLAETLALLDEQEIQIVQRYLGLVGERQSLETIAEDLNLSLHEVRQIAGRGVLKIRTRHLQLRQSGPAAHA